MGVYVVQVSVHEWVVTSYFCWLVEVVVIFLNIVTTNETKMINKLLLLNRVLYWLDIAKYNGMRSHEGLCIHQPLESKLDFQVNEALYRIGALRTVQVYASPSDLRVLQCIQKARLSPRPSFNFIPCDSTHERSHSHARGLTSESRDI